MKSNDSILPGQTAALSAVLSCQDSSATRSRSSVAESVWPVKRVSVAPLLQTESVCLDTDKPAGGDHLHVRRIARETES